MSVFISIIFEFVPIVIFLAIFLLMVLWIKYVNRLNLQSVGSDIGLSALFIQITLLAAPVWMSLQISINIIGHVTMTVFIFTMWILTVWLLKPRKPSRRQSIHLLSKVLDLFKKQSNAMESLSYVLGTFTLSLSLMMILNMVRFHQVDWRNQAVFLSLAALSSIAVGYGGYSLYRYLQDEQYSQSFKRFFNEITRDNILLTIQSGSTHVHDRDPVQPVVDIIRGSIMEGEPGPSLFGLNKLKKSCIELHTSSGMRRTNLNKVTLHYAAHIDEIGKLALRMEQDEVALESVRSLGEIGVYAASHDIGISVKDILQRLSEYYEVLQLKDFETMKLTVTHAISQIGSSAAAHGIEHASMKACDILDRNVTIDIRNNNSAQLKETTTALLNIGKQSVVNGQQSSIKHICIKLRDLGTSAVQIGLEKRGSSDSNLS